MLADLQPVALLQSAQLGNQTTRRPHSRSFRRPQKYKPSPTALRNRGCFSSKEKTVEIISKGQPGYDHQQHLFDMTDVMGRVRKVCDPHTLADCWNKVVEVANRINHRPGYVLSLDQSVSPAMVTVTETDTGKTMEAEIPPPEYWATPEPPKLPADAIPISLNLA